MKHKILLPVIFFAICALNTVRSFAGNWTQIIPPAFNHFNDVFFIDSLKGFIVGQGKTVLKTTDGGILWTSIMTGTGNLKAIHFPLPTTGYIVGIKDATNGFVFKTTDGGNTWIETGGLLPFLYDVFFIDNMNGYAVGQQGKIMKTTDGAVTWSNQPSGSIDELLSVHFLNPNQGFVCGQGQSILSTTNGGAMWSKFTLTNSNVLNKIHFSDATHGMAVGNSGKIFINSGAAVWTEIGSGTSENLFGLHYQDMNVVWVVGSNGTILNSQNNGGIWQPEVSGTTSELHAITFPSPKFAIAVGTSGIILRKTFEPPTCNPDFIFMPTQGGTELDMSFLPATVGNNFVFDWNFGDGITSTQPFSQHSFSARGDYNVCLNVLDTISGQSCSRCIMVRAGICAPEFIATPDSLNPLVIRFNDQSVSSGSITSWDWNFGDGSTAITQNPTHTFTNQGIYNVCFGITDTAYSSPCVMCRFISVGNPPDPNFSFSGQLYTKLGGANMGPASCPEPIYKILTAFDSTLNPTSTMGCFSQTTSSYQGTPANRFRLKFFPMQLNMVENLSDFIKTGYSATNLSMEMDTNGSQAWTEVLKFSNVNFMIEKKCDGTLMAQFHATISGGDPMLWGEFKSIYNSDRVIGNIIPFVKSGPASYDFEMNLKPDPNNIPIVGLPVSNIQSPLNFTGTGINMIFNSMNTPTAGDTINATVMFNNFTPPQALVQNNNIATIFNNNYWAMGTTADTFHVEVCFTYDPATLNTTATNLLSCVYQEFDGEPWQTITSQPTISDSTICFITDHLSNWALAITKSDAKAIGDTTYQNTSGLDQKVTFDFSSAGIEINEMLKTSEVDTINMEYYEFNPGGDLPENITAFNNEFWEFNAINKASKFISIDLTFLPDGDTSGFQKVLYRPDAATDWVPISSSRVRRAMKETLRVKIDTTLGHITLAKSSTKTELFNGSLSLASGCSQQSVTFNVTVTNGTPPYSYQWSGEGGFSSTDASPSYIYSSGTGKYSYSLTVTDENGAELIFSDSARVDNTPLVKIQGIVSGRSVSFTDSGSVGTNSLWNFGDGNSSSVNNPVHEYLSDGNYSVILTISNACGSAMDTMEIQVLTSIEEKLGNHSFIKVIPNPNNGTSTIFYNLTETNEVKVEIQNILGEKISEIRNSVQKPGTYSINLNLRTLNNTPSVSQGVYFLKFTSGEKVGYEKIVVY